MVTSWFAKPVYCESGNSSILLLSTKQCGLSMEYIWPSKPEQRISIILARSKLSVCNVNLVDGLVWNEEAVGSNPTTQTNF